MTVTNVHSVELASLRGSSKIVELHPQVEAPPAADTVQTYDGADPNAVMAAMIKMMESIQAAETEITKMAAANSTLQKSMGDEFLHAIIAEGKAMLEKMKQAEAAAEKAAHESHIGGILGIIAGAVMALVTVATCGLAAGMLAITMTVMMALPQDKNPLQLGAKGLGDVCHSDFAGQMLMIVAIAGVVMASGYGLSLGFEEGGNAAAEDGAENVASKVTRQSVQTTTRQVAADSIIGTSLMLNPLGTGADWISKKIGKDSSWVSPLLESIAIVITMAASYYLAKSAYGAGGPPGNELISREAAGKIANLGHTLGALCGLAAGGMDIAAGIATRKRADFLSDQADAQGAYTLYNGLMKALQSAIQREDKQQQATVKDYQFIGKNFAHLADPYKYMANASGVMA